MFEVLADVGLARIFQIKIEVRDLVIVFSALEEELLLVEIPLQFADYRIAFFGGDFHLDCVAALAPSPLRCIYRSSICT